MMHHHTKAQYGCIITFTWFVWHTGLSVHEIIYRKYKCHIVQKKVKHNLIKMRNKLDIK